jgi:hypothetical protein
MLVQILCDNPNSWIIPYALQLKTLLEQLNHHVRFTHKHEDIVSGDILMLLSCEKVFKNEVLKNHSYSQGKYIDGVIHSKIQQI